MQEERLWRKGAGVSKYRERETQERRSKDKLERICEKRSWKERLDRA